MEDVFLVADDNEPTRLLIAAILEKEGYPVMQAVDGGSAMTVAHDYNVVCALVDQYMEPQGGFDFARHVEAYNLNVPMILITAHSTSDLLMEAQKVGFSQVIQKPVEPERLIKTVQMVMRQKAS